MDNEIRLLLEENGWTVECESPFEIRHEDGSFATEQAASAVARELQNDAEIYTYRFRPGLKIPNDPSDTMWTLFSLIPHLEWEATDSQFRALRTDAESSGYRLYDITRTPVTEPEKLR